jgi:hypothetical protein
MNTHQNVFRLDIPVDQLISMQVRDAVQCVASQARAQLPRQRHISLSQQAAQVATVHELGDHVNVLALERRAVVRQ